MVVERGDLWWADLGEPDGSEPGFRRPVLIVQADAFNRSRLQTVIAVVLTFNLRLVDAPGNVLMPAKATGLLKDAVANNQAVLSLAHNMAHENGLTAAMIDVLTEYVKNKTITPEQAVTRLAEAVEGAR